MSQQYRILNSRLPRVDALDKATGRAVYTDDIRRPGMLVGALLHSLFGVTSASVG